MIDNALGAKTLMRENACMIIAKSSTYSALNLKIADGMLAADGRENRSSSSGKVTLDRLTWNHI